MSTFSKRFGHFLPEKPVTTRNEAPQGLRDFVVQSLYAIGYEPSFLRGIICRILRVRPDANNWSEYPNISSEVSQLIDDAEWFQVYDFIEAFYNEIRAKDKEQFEEELNDYFKQNGIGWKIESGELQIRGDETFESAIHKVEDALEAARLPTAQTEIREAIRDLSRRPEADITGAIQHSLASLECVCREALGDRKATLGDLMKKANGIIPPPLDIAVSKIWGFTSEQGRHLKEGNPPNLFEAELVVELSSALISYLSKKLSVPEEKKVDDGLPF